MSLTVTTYARTAGLEQEDERLQEEPVQDKEEVDVEGMSTQLGGHPRGERPWGDQKQFGRLLLEVGCPRDGMAEPRSLLSAIVLKRQRTRMRSRLCDGPKAIVVCTAKDKTCRTRMLQWTAPKP